MNPVIFWFLVSYWGGDISFSPTAPPLKPEISKSYKSLEECDLVGQSKKAVLGTFYFYTCVGAPLYDLDKGELKPPIIDQEEKDRRILDMEKWAHAKARAENRSEEHT